MMNKCGDCQLWMKKKECPREKGTMNGGPTMNDLSCGGFIANHPPSPGQAPAYLQQVLADALKTSPSDTGESND